MPINPDMFMLLQGATSNLRGEVFCSVNQPGFEMPSDACLEGPFSRRGKTLTAKYPLRLFEEPSQLRCWKSVIPEPVLWTPRMPAYYELRGIPGLQKRIGLRELFTRKDSFYREGRRWVARAAFSSLKKAYDEIEDWYREDFIPILSPEFIAFRDYTVEYGLPLIVDLSQQFSLGELSRCMLHASISMVLLPPMEIPPIEAAKMNHVTIGTRLSEPGPIPKDMQFVAVSEAMLRDGWRPERRIPVVAIRECDVNNHSVAELRALCDQFQAELEHGAEYAGLWLFPKGT